MKFFVVTLLVCSSLNASQDLNDSAKSNQQAMSTLKQSFGVAQAKINSECVEPTSDLMCNESTASTVNMLSGVLSQIVSSAASGTSGQVISGAIGGVSCMLIKCDTTQSRNSKCNGSETTSVCMCGSASIGTSTGADAPCKSGTQTNIKRQACLDQDCCCSTPEETEGCSGEYNAIQMPACTAAITKCDSCKSSDDAKVDNTDMCDGDYKTCIQSYKTKAKTRQTKCRLLCDSMVALLSAFNSQQTGVAASVAELQKQTTSAGDNTNTHSNNNTVSNTNSTPTYDNTPSTMDKLLSLFSGNKNNNNTSAASGTDTAAASTSGTGTASGEGAKSPSSGSGDKSINPTADSNRAASSFAGSGSGGAGSFASSDSNGIDTSKKLKGLKKTNNDQGYIGASGDLFIQVSAIYVSNYKTGIIGKENTSNVSKKKVRR